MAIPPTTREQQPSSVKLWPAGDMPAVLPCETAETHKYCASYNIAASHNYEMYGDSIVCDPMLWADTIFMAAMEAGRMAAMAAVAKLIDVATAAMVVTDAPPGDDAAAAVTAANASGLISLIGLSGLGTGSGGHRYGGENRNTAARAVVQMVCLDPDEMKEE